MTKFFNTSLSSRRKLLLGCTLGGVGLVALMGNGFKTVKVFNKTAQQFFADPQVAALAEAAALGRVAEVDRLIQSGVPVDSLGDERFTPLSFALLAANAAGVEALLKHGANPNHRIDAPTTVGGLPIVLFIINSDRADMLELFLRHGADPNTRRPPNKSTFDRFPYAGESLLNQSALKLEHVKVLVKYGADVNFRAQSGGISGGGRTTIDKAAGLGHLAVVEYLLAHGATVGLDGAADGLQSLPVKPELRPNFIRVLRLLHAKGAKIYRGYRPMRDPDPPVMYVNQDLPQDLLSPGYYEPKDYTGDTPYTGPMD